MGAICCISRALWTTALALMVMVRAAHERWHFTGFSNAQEAREGAIHPALNCSIGWRGGCRSRRCAATCSSRTRRCSCAT